MKKRILFFVIALLLIGCSPESKVHKSDPESYPAQVDRLVIDTRQRAERLGVEWTTEEAEELRETLLGPATATEKAQATIQASRLIAERYRQRVKETIEERVEVACSTMGKALDWRLAELLRVPDGASANAQEKYDWLLENRSSLLQSFEVQLREYLDQNGFRVPQNGELLECLRKAGAWFERCYRACDILDDLCWDRCTAGFIARIAACPGMAPGALKMPKEPEQGHPWGEQK